MHVFLAAPLLHLGIMCLNLWAAARFGGVIPVATALLLSALDVAQLFRVHDKAALLAKEIVANEKTAKKRQRRQKQRNYWDQK